MIEYFKYAVRLQAVYVFACYPTSIEKYWDVTDEDG
jgi:hypothetical protein